MRLPFLPREKAAYAKLRNVGLSINQISTFSGRSTSVIQRALKRLEVHGAVHMSIWMRSFDMRKLRGRANRYHNKNKWDKLLTLWHAWELWILGEGEKPP